jgi:hypothetical protein
MSFNALEFRSKLKYGGLRPNLFQVALNIPDSASASEEVAFMAEASNTPAFVTGYADTYYFGRRVSWPADREWTDWTITIIQDETFNIRNALEAWQDRCSRSNWGTNHMEQARGLNLFSDASIKEYGKEGDVLREVKMFNAFPIMIGPLEHSWSSNNQISRFTVDFRYDYCEVQQISSKN